MERTDLIEVQKDAARALEAGAKLAQRVAARRHGHDVPDKPSSAALGALLGNPGVFWSGATAIEAGGDSETVRPMLLALKYAGARLAVGDYNFVREALLGQSQWLSVVAAKLMQRAGETRNHQASVDLIKLSLSAQRQAAGALATAAALGRLQGADAVSVEG